MTFHCPLCDEANDTADPVQVSIRHGMIVYSVKCKGCSATLNVDRRGHVRSLVANRQLAVRNA